MTTTKKLTLSIDELIIEKAKAYAQKQGLSLSALVENYLKILVRPAKYDEISPVIEQLTGVAEMPADFDYKKMIGDWRLEDYLRGAEEEAEDEDES